MKSEHTALATRGLAYATEETGQESVRVEYGIEFYQTIGEKGGEPDKLKYGVDFYREIDGNGGGVVKGKYGPKFIGMKGNSLPNTKMVWLQNQQRLLDGRF